MKTSPRSLKWICFGAALTLGACATLSPQEKADYAQAQTEVQQLEADPLANQAAGRPLQQARDALANADTAAQHHDAADVTYWSYLASRHAEVGEAMIAELRARNQVAAATAERGRILLDSQRHQTQLAREQAQQAQQQAQAAQQELQQDRQQQQAQQAQQQLAQVREQAQQQVEQAQEEAQRQTQQARQQLEEMQARQTAQGMVLTLSGSLLFATGHDTLEPGALEPLNNIARFMQQHPMMKIRVEGFTDNRGTDELNDALSQRRAQAVATALEADGVDSSRLEVLGRGKSLPVASNDTSAGRQQNRRVELLFSDTEGAFAGTQGGQQLR